MTKITLLAAFVLAAALSPLPVLADELSAGPQEAALRVAAENILTLSDEDYRDVVKSAPAEARWAKLERPSILKISFKSLANSRRRRAVEKGLVSVGREIDADAKAAGPDAELLQQTGWWSDLSTQLSQSAVMGERPHARGPAVVAAVRGGRKLSTDTDKEVTRLLAAIDAGDQTLSSASMTDESSGEVHLQAARSYDKIAALVDAPAAATPSGDAVREASVRTAAEKVLTMSDEDFRDMAKSATPESFWAKLDRPGFLNISFKGLAANRRRRAVAAGLVSAGREIDADAKAAGPDADLLQQTGLWENFTARVAQLEHSAVIRDPNRRVPTAVAAVRGGRKLSTETDKEVTRLLAAADAGNHLEAAQAYDKLAAIFAPAPAAPAARAMSAKEIYQRAAPSVVLILAAEKEGAGELGTGSIIEGGRILTNAHVVINDRTGRPFAAVRLYQKPERVVGDTKRDLKDPIVAKVERFDRALDLAILEPETRLKAGPLTLGDDSAVEPGDPVVAIGHPEQGGLWTLTQGVVSTVIADLGGVAGKDAFQTDTSINRGNSGGPLIDRTGSIIGVNTSMARKAADGLTITSVNFSVKSSVARRWIGGDSAPAAAAVAAIAPAAEAAAEPAAEAPAAPAAPAVEAPKAPAALPPAPTTKPKILTPQAPYRVDDVLAQEMKEMEDLEGEMRREIEARGRK
jgi:serine protease Do